MLNSIKTVLSYLIDIPVEKRESQYSGSLEISISNGQYKLSTPNAIYSYGNKYTSFGIAFEKIKVEQYPIKSVLVLGLGLGSVIQMLATHTTIQHIVAVDADEVIIELAKKYLPNTQKYKIQFVCADAEIFMHNNTQQFDLVLFDVFIGSLTPVPFMQLDFLNTLHKSVKDNGILLYSKINDSLHSKIENTQFAHKFTQIFYDAFTIDAQGNLIFTWINKSNAINKQ